MSPPLRRLIRFLSELKRRNVYRVAVTYLVVAFVGLQAAKLLVPSTTLPAWTDELILVLLIVGFPVAVVIAWAFELTPDGMRTTRPSSGRGLRRDPGRRAAVYVGFGLLVVGSAFVGYTLLASSKPDAGLGEGRARALAVLPFVDMSRAGDQTYLGDGVAEEILDALSQLDGFEVKARTSSFRFRHSRAGIRAIADSLGVDGVLEGSVRRLGDRIKVTAELVDGKTENRIWSKSYDRRLADLFTVQEEIARSVVRALKVSDRSERDHPIVGIQTSDPVAHEDYLRARDLWKSRDFDKLTRSVDLYRQAIERDSSYARAWAGLADAYNVLRQFGIDGSAEKARHAARRAMTLDSSLPEPHATLGMLLGDEWKWREADSEFREALRLNPDYATAHHWYSLLLGALSRPHEALQRARRALELDPWATQINRNLGFLLYWTGNYAELVEHEKRQRDLAISTDFDYYLWTGLARLAMGETEDALRNFRRLGEVDAENGRLQLYSQAGIAMSLGQMDEREQADKALGRAKRFSRDYPADGAMIAYALTALGKIDSAFAWVNQGPKPNVWALAALRNDPVFEPLRSDPRYDSLLAAVGLE